MTFDYFWFTLNEVKAWPEDISFGLFSAAHLIWLLVVAVLGALYVKVYSDGSAKRRTNLRNAMALFVIFSEIFKICFQTLKGEDSYQFLPLEICSFAEYAILIDAMWPRNNLLKQMMAFVFMPAAMIALLVPTAVWYPPVNVITLRFFLLHGGIVIYTIAQLVTGEIRPRYKGIWTSLAAVSALVLVIYRIDVMTGSNFMFLTSHEDNPALMMIWNISGGSGGIPYLIALAAFLTAGMHAFYGIYRILGKRRSD